ncbi:DUF6443 domain-containing protein [Dyadobacter sp. 32]|uniref:DUF6443 domain-containing protein n=1 Tax=Dyadobacter sp. 32 TaxID=538966 RepID=UPI0011EFE44E
MKRLTYCIIVFYTILSPLYGQQTSSRNYIVSRTYKQAGADVNDVSKVVTQVQYLDGLGRILQNVAVKQSPEGGDMVEPVAFDAAGRQSRKYLPYAAFEDWGSYRADGISEATNWYSSNSAFLDNNDLERPYTDIYFEASPLNRVSGMRAPGNKSAGSSVQYKINGSSDVKRYDFNETTNTISQNGNYPAGTLKLVQSTDEQGKQTNEYHDNLGQLICKEQVNGTERLSTYYVYDDLNLLRGVLQPAFQDSPSLTDFAFTYDYDERGRLIVKRIPGAGIVEIVYDRYDRPVYNRDANQTARGVWGFTKYDALNRPVMTGEISSSSSRSDLAGTVNGASHHEDRSNGTIQGYSLNQTAPASVTEADLLTITFYDDYGFSKAGLDYSGAYYGSNFANVKGRQSGSRARILPGSAGTGSWLSTVVYYDSEYRPIQTVRELYDLGATTGIERLSTKYKYDLAPVASEQKTEQLLSTGTNTHVAYFTYDQADRLLAVSEKVINGSKTKQAYTLGQRYNALGQLRSKWQHSDDGVLFRHRTDYTNNIRGWMTDAKTVYKQTVNGGDLPYYSLGLAYDNGANYTNGNISQMQWSGKDESAFTKGLSFAYDDVNRLTGSAGLSGYGDTESGILYDKNGNIITLIRAGAAIDNLVYTYASNRLTSINDATGSNTGVKSGASSYGYDGNGNMTSDGNRGAVLTYNYLNLPKTVAISGKTLTYDYDASRTKHKYVADTLTVKYAGAFEYNQNSIFKRLSISDGQAVIRQDSIRFDYYLKDHLGNVRVVFDEKGAILQKNDYYPFGLEIDRTTPVQTPAARNAINRYTFLGRETQPETGYIDLQARFYDPALGRFFSIDPETEGQLEFSPYHYSFNNPIRFSDPDGRFPECCGGFGDFLTGFGNALTENIAGSSPIRASPGYIESYNNGRTFGHAVSAVGGAFFTAKGAVDVGASGTALVVSGGTAAPLAVPGVIVGVGEMAIGINTMSNAIDNLRNDKGRVNASSTENTGRGSNHLKPDPKAQGDHSTFRTDPKTGKTTNTATYAENPRNPKTGFQETKRVDVSGKPHIHSQTKEPIPTPHVIEPKQKNPRPARPDELPRQ